jgi:ribosomal peptide maturation radical SAM protein 1
MKVRLIALPWNQYWLPQASLGALSAYLKQREPSWDVRAQHAFLDVASEQPALYAAVASHDFEGERVYASLMYRSDVEPIAALWRSLGADSKLGAYLARTGRDPIDVIAELHQRLDRHLDALVDAGDWEGTVVGLSTSFSQLFGSLLLAERIKARSPSAIIVLGGSTVSPARIADSILATYPSVDFIVRGEGELAFHALIERVASGGTGPLPDGVVDRATTAASTRFWQVDDLDALPPPDYDSFYDRAGPTGGRMVLPIEGSRGCWWDRTTRSPKSTCQFCNLNVQWNGYRAKSPHRIAAEMHTLSSRYRTTYINFLDNIVRHRGYDELITAIDELGIDAQIFHEARANLRPVDILRFYEVGLRVVQFGLEGLSTRFLKRINKGTTTIMNLEVMKTCAELGIESQSNLIVGFPGSTPAEVTETVETIERYAFAYPPTNIAGFELGIDNVVSRFPEDFGITNIRNHERYEGVIPSSVLDKLVTFQFSYETTGVAADWGPVVQRVQRWTKEYRPHPLWYQHGGEFLHVFRKRGDAKLETFELTGLEATLYHHCLAMRSREEIDELMGAERSAVDAVLERLIRDDIMYREGSRYLALATAPTPAVAARRIHRQARVVARRSPRLAIVTR